MNIAGRRLSILAVALFVLPFGVRAQETPPPPPASTAPATPAQQTEQAVTPAPAPTTFEITGSAKSGKTPLPGVTVTAANSLTGKKYVAATNSEGKFTFAGMPRGRYVVKIEFMGFATFTQEVLLNPENPSAKVDAELMLASRRQEQSINASAALAAAGRGFQSLAMENTLSSLDNGNNGFGGANGSGGGQSNGGDISSLPLGGAGAEGPTESVSVSGAQGRTQDFGFGSEEDLQSRIQEFRDRMQREGGGSFGPPPGGGGGGPGQIIMMGRMPRGFNINQPHGVFYYSDDNANLDARPFSLTGIPTPQAYYNQARFGANMGGPLNIPKIFHGGNKWFFFGGWNGSRGDTPYDAFSTVPAPAERGGDFSQAVYNDGKPVQIFNPQTGQQYQFSNGSSSCAQPCPNVLDPALITPAAKTLLNYIPLPNMPPNTLGQNFHYVTSANSSTDSVAFRLVHNFSSSGGPGGGGPFFIGAPGIAIGGAGGGRRRAQNNINFGLNWARSSTAIVNPFPSLAGGTSTQGLNASAGWVYGKGRATNMFRVNYNHNKVEIEVGFIRAGHRFTNDFCSKYPHRLKSLIVVTNKAIDVSVQEIKTWAKAPWVAGIHPHLDEGFPIDHPDLEPIWAAANEAGLCVAHHSFTEGFPGYRDLWDNPFLGRSASHPWAAMRAMAAFFGAGIMERYPNIRYCILESGFGWLPFWAARLDDQSDYISYALPENLAHKPSEYITSGRFFASIVIHEGEKMTKMVSDYLGDSLLMYSSDYPHPESRFPGSTDVVLAWKSLGDEVMRKMFWDNATKCFGEP